MAALETRIEEVTVYTDRAQVVRRGTVTLGAGPQELLIEDLPSVLVPESVRAGARAPVPTRLLGTDVARTFHKDPPEARPAELQAEIERLTDRDEALSNEAEARGARRTFLQNLAASSGTEIARGIAPGGRSRCSWVWTTALR
jgi:hypothetical protein